METQTQAGMVGKIAVIGIVITEVVTITLSSGVLTLWSGLVGLLLILLLLAYGEHGNVSQTSIERLVSSSAFGLSSLLIFGWLLRVLYQMLPGSGYHIVLGNRLLGMNWSLFAFVFWLLATFVWMKIRPRQSWPRLFQMVA